MDPGQSGDRTAAPGLMGMRLKVGVMGGASGDFTPDVLDRAHAFGDAIARNGCVLVTGACPGLPLAAAEAVAAERTIGGDRYVFCSTTCARRFDADPQRYVDAVKNHG